MPQLLDIPDTVIRYYLLHHLNWNDLLRLRRVCTWTKWITDGYLWNNSVRAPEIEINEGDKSLEAFISMGIPTARIFLDNAASGYYFYKQIDEETQQHFLGEHGPFVKHLRVAQMTETLFGRELDFIDGLKNLESFEAGYFGCGRKNFEDDWDEAEMEIISRTNEDPRLIHYEPRSLKSLQSVRIGLDPFGFSKTYNIVLRSTRILLNCTQLKHASLPFDSTFFQGLELEDGRPGIYRALANAFANLVGYISERPNRAFSSDDGKVQLEVFDFENYHHENVPWTLESSQVSLQKLLTIWHGSVNFLPVCSRALKLGLKLRNVNARWFCAKFVQQFQDLFDSLQLGTPVESLVGLDPSVMDLEMPNLEKIRIPSTSDCFVGENLRPDWPGLRCVDITVDGKVGNVWETYGKTRFEDIRDVQGQPTRLLFKFLFGNGIVCLNMRELSIDFVDGMAKDELAVPKVEDIVGSCPNLKKIKLARWPGKNKALLKLWKGLPGLEEITLEDCKEVGNVTFVGEDARDPLFFKLKNLKKLTLKGLDEMPKITDLVFTLVLSKMKIKQLVFTAAKPLEKITKEGINSLLEGPFNESIEKFPFKDWSLAGVSVGEFEELGKKFRSYEML